MNIKDEVINISISRIKSISLEALTSNEKIKKEVALEIIRSCINRIAVVMNEDFTHTNLHFYVLQISLLEMAIVNLRNLTRVVDTNKIEEYLNDSDEVFDMLDRWETTNEE